MPLQVRCPNPSCARTAAVEPARMGRKFQCPGCGRVFLAHPDPTLVTGASGTRGGSGSWAAPPSAPATIPPAARVGRFVVKGRLGHGAFGTVYRAYDPHLDREVALKVPNPGVVDSASRVERFLREAKAAANLRHPHIVPVFDAGKDGDRYFIASAFIDGQPLAQAVDENGTDFRRAARLVKELADSLAYAHGQGVVHRDVKPANAMLDKADHLHLMDFGLAARGEDTEDTKLTRDGAVLGTPGYMAPEQAAGQHGDAKPAADQYSAGVVLYELLTGQLPFVGPPVVVLHNVVHTPPEPPGRRRAGVPRDLETICLKAMAKRPADRYPSCHALAADLRRFLDGEPITARRQSARERLVRWSRANPVAAGLAAAVVVILTAGVVVSSGFAVSANREKGRAEQAEADVRANLDKAEEAAKEAREAKGKAEREATNARAAEKQAEADRSAAEGRRVEAEKAKEDAARAAKEAEEAKNQAKADAARAKDAEAKAVTALDDLKTSQAEIARLAYAPLIRSAQQHLDRKAQAEGRRVLDRCPPTLRGWEWDHLSARAAPPEQTAGASGRTPRLDDEIPVSPVLSAISANGGSLVYFVNRSSVVGGRYPVLVFITLGSPPYRVMSSRSFDGGTVSCRGVAVSPSGAFVADIVGETVTLGEARERVRRANGDTSDPALAACKSLGGKLSPRRVGFLSDSVLAIQSGTGSVLFHRVAAVEVARAASGNNPFEKKSDAGGGSLPTAGNATYRAIEITPLPGLTIDKATGPDDPLGVSGDGWLATGAGVLYRVNPDAAPHRQEVGENFLKVMRDRVGDPIRTLQLIAVAPRGRLVAFADSKNGVYVFNPLAKSDSLVPVSGAWQNIQRLRFTPDGRRLVFCGRYGPVLLADADTGEVLLSLQTGATAVVEVGFSDTEQTLFAILADGRILSWRGKTVEKTDMAPPGAPGSGSGVDPKRQ